MYFSKNVLFSFYPVQLYLHLSWNLLFMAYIFSKESKKVAVSQSISCLMLFCICNFLARIQLQPTTLSFLAILHWCNCSKDNIIDPLQWHYSFCSSKAQCLNTSMYCRYSYCIQMRQFSCNFQHSVWKCLFSLCPLKELLKK